MPIRKGFVEERNILTAIAWEDMRINYWSSPSPRKTRQMNLFKFFPHVFIATTTAAFTFVVIAYAHHNHGHDIPDVRPLQTRLATPYNPTPENYQFPSRPANGLDTGP